MANKIVKTEMGKNNGRDRWCHRADAKEEADKLRRQNDQAAVDEGFEELADALYAQMQTPESKKALREAFNASPEELAAAALAAVKS